MSGMAVLWIIVGLAALVIVVALIAGAAQTSSQRQAEQERREAYESQPVWDARAESDERPTQNLWPEYPVRSGNGTRESSG